MARTAIFVSLMLICSDSGLAQPDQTGEDPLNLDMQPIRRLSSSKGEFSRTRLVVKFRVEGENRVTPEAYSALQRLDAEVAPPAQRAKVKVLTQLGRECGLKKVTHAFFGESVTDPMAAAKYQQDLVSRIRLRFPARSRRAPESKVPDLSPYFVLEFDGSRDIQDVCERFERSELVEAVHLDPLARTQQLPNDPFLTSRGSWGQDEEDLWGLKRIGAPEAWNTTKGRGVTVAVVDTGLDFDHPDIAGNFWLNAGETPSNGVDDDGNGFVDDVRGWDFPNNDADPMDDTREGHGTHVSGIIAAVADNGEGIVGVAPEAKVMAVKAIGSDGSVAFSIAAQAVLYAISNGADVINCSWGPGPSFIIPLEIEDLIRFGHGLGVVFVFASGNDSTTVTDQSPMNMKEILTVGAATPTDEAMSRSNWGRYLDVLAPGGSRDVPPPSFQPRRSILSLKSKSFTNSENGKALVVGERYVRLSGTSMAAPHVSGVVALVLATNPDLTNEDAMSLVKAAADSNASSHFDLRAGAGRVNVATAVALAAHKPPTLRITEPAENEELPVGGATVSIRGVVGGRRLREFQLFISQMDNLSVHKPLGPPTSSPVDGELVSWDTKELLPGCYALRLVATDVDGNRFEDLVQVTKSPPALTRVEDPSDIQDAVACDRYVAWVVAGADEASEDRSYQVVLLNRGTGKRIIVDTLSQSPVPLALSDRHLAYCARDEEDERYFLKMVGLDSGESFTIHDVRGRPITLGISGKLLYWDEMGGSLYTYHIPSGRVTKVSGRATADSPHLAGDQAVWITGQSNVAVCELGSGKVRLLTEDGHIRPKESPRVAGHRVAWREGPNPNEQRLSDIILYDLEEDTIRFVASARPLVQGPEFAGEMIVWSDCRNGNRDVYSFDLRTGRERAITTSSDSEALPRLEGNAVLWQRFLRVPERPEGRYLPAIEIFNLDAVK